MTFNLQAPSHPGSRAPSWGMGQDFSLWATLSTTTGSTACRSSTASPSATVQDSPLGEPGLGSSYQETDSVRTRCFRWGDLPKQVPEERHLQEEHQGQQDHSLRVRDHDLPGPLQKHIFQVQTNLVYSLKLGWRFKVVTRLKPLFPGYSRISATSSPTSPTTTWSTSSATARTTTPPQRSTTSTRSTPPIWKRLAGWVHGCTSSLY